MRPKHVKALLEEAIKNPCEIPPIFLEGPPGIGKSAIPHQVAEEAKIGFLDTRASQHDPTDFRGIPAVLVRDGKEEARWLPPEDIPYEKNKNIPECGLWFLDEITAAPPLVQAVLYQATLDHKIGEHPLKKGWYIMAAGNRIEDRAVTYRMSSALANRFMHIQFEINLDDWVDWARITQINPNIIMFLKFKPDLIFRFNPESSEKAFATPRTWAFASQVIKFTPTKILPEALEGTVGKGATAEFMAFLKLQTQLPDIQTIIDGKNDFVPDRVDLKYALVAALATRVKGVKQCERMLQYSVKLDTEFAVLLVTMLAQKDETSMGLAPSFESWSMKHADVILTKRALK